MLSEKVTVNGVLQEDDLPPRQFEFSLDRSGEESNITASIEAAKQVIEKLDDLPTYSEYVEGDFNTFFYYELR